jgi:hypothetical protein
MSGHEGKPKAHHGIINLDKFVLLEPCSDSKARLKVKEGKDEFYLKDFFEDGEGPKQFPLDAKGAHFEDLCKQTIKAIDDQKSRIQAILPASAADDLLNARTKRVREEALVKARAAGAHKPKRQRSHEHLARALENGQE